MEALRAKRLLVEGTDDLYAVAELMGHHIQWDKPPPVSIVPCNGDEMFVPGRISVELKSDAVVGVIIDADDNGINRWGKLRAQGLPFFPKIPLDLPQDGLVVSNSDGQRFGVWIMPDNRQDGMLETFLHWLVPDGNQPLWSHAQVATEAAKRNHGAMFKDVHYDKARIHTWLAWMDPPGERLGGAIRAKILDPASARAQPFIAWFRRLYEL